MNNELVNVCKGDEAAAKKIIHLSIANGWKRFFELKSEKNGNSKSFGQQGSERESVLSAFEKIVQCLIKMDVQETKSEAKLEFISLVSDLMPAGMTTFLSMIKYPMIKNLINEHGKKTMLKVVFLLIRDFCNSINVVRNMNQDQMIEAAAMLIDECNNFRLEDYTVMFGMDKRGALVKILDRIDISIITQMLDEYWKRRNLAAIKLQESETLEGLGPSSRLIDNLHPLDAKISNSVNNLAIAFGDLKSKLTEWKEVNKENTLDNQ